VRSSTSPLSWRRVIAPPPVRPEAADQVAQLQIAAGAVQIQAQAARHLQLQTQVGAAVAILQLGGDAQALIGRGDLEAVVTEVAAAIADGQFDAGLVPALHRNAAAALEIHFQPLTAVEGIVLGSLLGMGDAKGEEKQRSDAAASKCESPHGETPGVGE